MERTTRCFIALDLPKDMINHLQIIQNDIKKQELFKGNLTNPEHIHLTLKFLGNIEESKIKLLQERLRKLSFNSFEADITELGVFSEEFVRIIWAKLNGTHVLDLQKRIDDSIVDLFLREERFMSHITIARVHTVQDKKKLIDYVKNYGLPRIKSLITSFSLVKSTLTAQRPIYEAIERYELK